MKKVYVKIQSRTNALVYRVWRSSLLRLTLYICEYLITSSHIENFKDLRNRFTSPQRLGKSCIRNCCNCLL